MKNELRIFLTAIMFYTRIPCPAWVGYSEENLNKATRYLPLIGWIVGGLTAFSVWLFQLVLPINISVILSVILGVLLTGAFHEDGFADVCDGFGGGWTKEKILEIMKDSRVGAYGVIGTVLLLTLKILVFTELCKSNLAFGLMSLLLAHVLSRFAALTTIFTHTYSRADTKSKVKPIAKKIDTGSLIIGFIWVIPTVLIFYNYVVILVLIPVYLTKVLLAAYFKKWIGGYTGDCLGAIQQVTEVITLLSCLVLWKFI